MPLLFSYGTLQEERVQMSTLGRRLEGKKDELVACESTLVPIEDPAIAAATGKSHHANVLFNGNDQSRVPGLVFEVSDAELASLDAYEAPFAYERVAGMLASGKLAWVYVHAQSG
jgi:gamma-glutamylcyclotransferase (GGCT)/AIG2-like uncharacterized protein YtfP